MKTDILKSFIGAMSATVLPVGTVYDGASATPEFHYGFQIFSVEGDFDFVLTRSGLIDINRAKEVRASMFQELVEHIYPMPTIADYKVVCDKRSEPPVQDPAPKNPDGVFFSWAGDDNKMPNGLAYDDKVDVVFRCGTSATNIQAGNVDWTFDPVGGNFDILEYRLHVAESIPEGFERWTGCRRGVFPGRQEDKVEIIHRDGYSEIAEIGEVRWNHIGSTGDVIGYRHVYAEAEAEESPAEAVKIPDGYTKWEAGSLRTSGPADLNATDIVKTFLRCGLMPAAAQVNEWNWHVDGSDGDILAYQVVQKSTKTPDLPDGFIEWEGVNVSTPEGLNEHDTVEVMFRDGSTARGRVDEYTWENDPRRPLSVDVIGYTVIHQVGGKELDILVYPDAGDLMQFAKLTMGEQNPAELNFGPVMFKFADNSVVVAKDGRAFYEDTVKGASTFRQAKPSETIVGFLNFPNDAVFWNPKTRPGMTTVCPKEIMPTDEVTIYTVSGNFVKRDAWSVDWRHTGDPENDVVAFEVY